MSTHTQQRILWGAGTLVLAIWFLGPGNQGFSEMLTFSAVFGFGGLALWLKFVPSPKPIREEPSTPLTQAKLHHTLDQTATLLGHLQDLTTGGATTVSPLSEQLVQIRADLDRSDIRLVVMGSTAVGKSTLIELLQSQWLSSLKTPCIITETDQVLAEQTPTESMVGQKNSLSVSPILPGPLQGADLVLFLIQGDLTDSEYQSLQFLQAQQQRVFVVLNKQDQYLPPQRLALQQKLQQQLSHWLTSDDLLAIAACPQDIKVRRYHSNGDYTESLEPLQPQIEDLVQRLTQVMTTEAEQLILQQTYQQTLRLRSAIQGQLHHQQRQLALPIIERYQWITGATAFANPLPTLDMLAAAAMTGKMVIELGELYRLKFSVAQAQAVTGTLASTMLKLGLVEVSTQTLSSLLKGHSFTFVAGGLVQGVSAAHLTRVAGLSLIEHFQDLSDAALGSPDMAWSPEQLKQILTRVFQEQQRLDFLKAFVQQAIGRFRRQGGVLESAAGSS